MTEKRRMPLIAVSTRRHDDGEDAETVLQPSRFDYNERTGKFQFRDFIRETSSED